MALVKEGAGPDRQSCCCAQQSRREWRLLQQLRLHQQVQPRHLRSQVPLRCVAYAALLRKARRLRPRAEQFSKYANLFFLFTALIQQIPDVSPTNPYTTIAPLSVVLLASAFKETQEDLVSTSAVVPAPGLVSHPHAHVPPAPLRGERKPVRHTVRVAAPVCCAALLSIATLGTQE